MTNNPALNFFISGVLLGSGACLVSCGPMLVFYFAGMHKDIKKSLISYGIFCFSRMLIYSLLGVLVFAVGQFATERIFGHSGIYINILGGIFIMLIGVFMIFGKIPGRSLIANLRGKLAGSDSAIVALLGVIVGLAPCGPLLAVLSYVGLFSKTWLNALVYSLSFGLGTAISPAIILVIVTGMFSRYVKIPNSKVIDFTCGLIIIILGLELAFKSFL